MELNDMIIAVMQDKYIEMIRKDRKKRRELIDHLDQYVEWMKKSKAMTENIMEVSTQIVLD